MLALKPGTQLRVAARLAVGLLIVDKVSTIGWDEHCFPNVGKIVAN